MCIGNNKNCYLRVATENDARLLYDWRCDSAVRLSAFSSNHFSYDSHVSWLKKSLSDEDIKIFILILNNQAQIPIGQTRVNRKKSLGYIDYSIDSKYRGNGYGILIIDLLQDKMREISFVKKLVAEVKKENIASRNVFERLGFEKAEKENCFVYNKNIIRENEFEKGEKNMNINKIYGGGGK